MGMFDEVEVHYPLPDGADPSATRFQTKSFDNVLERYQIMADGRLLKMRARYEVVPEEERPLYGTPEWDMPLGQSCGMLRQVEKGWEAYPYTGEMEIYGGESGTWRTYKLWLRDGVVRDSVAIAEQRPSAPDATPTPPPAAVHPSPVVVHGPNAAQPSRDRPCPVEVHAAKTELVTGPDAKQQSWPMTTIRLPASLLQHAEMLADGLLRPVNDLLVDALTQHLALLEAMSDDVGEPVPPEQVFARALEHAWLTPAGLARVRERIAAHERWISAEVEASEREMEAHPGSWVGHEKVERIWRAVGHLSAAEVEEIQTEVARDWAALLAARVGDARLRPPEVQAAVERTLHDLAARRPDMVTLPEPDWYGATLCAIREWGFTAGRAISRAATLVPETPEDAARIIAVRIAPTASARDLVGLAAVYMEAFTDAQETAVESASPPEGGLQKEGSLSGGSAMDDDACRQPLPRSQTVEGVVTRRVQDEGYDLAATPYTDEMSPSAYLDLALDHCDAARGRLLRLRNDVVGRDWEDSYDPREE